MRGVDIDSDHYLEIARLRFRISARPPTNKPQRKFYTAALKRFQTAQISKPARDSLWMWQNSCRRYSWNADILKTFMLERRRRGSEINFAKEKDV